MVGGFEKDEHVAFEYVRRAAEKDCVQAVQQLGVQVAVRCGVRARFTERRSTNWNEPSSWVVSIVKRIWRRREKTATIKKLLPEAPEVLREVLRL